MISLQTNLNSLMAQANLRVNTESQSRTIRELTSGYRINSSGDDSGNLSVANKYRNDIAGLAEGVRNANDGIGLLQIADAGLSNMSQVLDRLKTLATESASSTFTGDRGVLENEYKSLLVEITRQAANIGLESNGSLNRLVSIYIGGGSGIASGGGSSGSQVNVDLSAASNAVDAVSLGLQGTQVASAPEGSSFIGNSVTNLSDVSARFNIGTAGAETFNVSYVNGSGALAADLVTVHATAGGVSGSDFAKAISDALTSDGVAGVTASIGPAGDLQFGGAKLLSVAAGTAGTAPTSLAVNGSGALLNAANYHATGTLTPFVDGGGGQTAEILKVTVGATNYPITLDSSGSGGTSASSAANAVASLNQQLNGSGVYAVNFGNGITLASAASFGLQEMSNTPGSSGARTVGSGSLAGDANDSAALSLSCAFTPLTAASDGTPTTEQLSLEIRGSEYYDINLSSASVGATAADTVGDAVNSINQQLQSQGLHDVVASDGGGGNITLTATGTDWVATYEMAYDNGSHGSLLGTAAGAVPVTENGAMGFEEAFTDGSEAMTVHWNGLQASFTLNGSNAGTESAMRQTVNQALQAAFGHTLQCDIVGGRAYLYTMDDSPFTATVDNFSAGGGGVAGSGSLFGTTPGTVTVNDPLTGTALDNGTSVDTADHARAAISAIDNALTLLGDVQGVIGAGQNVLSDAVSLAQSQITNFSAAESGIRDADIAAEAALLTKAQILQQSSIAAMVQANTAAQSILRLLQ